MTTQRDTTQPAGGSPVERRVRPRYASANGWLEAAIAWEVCASIHETFAKGKDALYTTRHGDFVKHADDSRSKAQSDDGTLLRAADMLTAYAELIRRDGATHVEEHHYLPDVEFIAAELRARAAALDSDLHPDAQPKLADGCGFPYCGGNSPECIGCGQQ